MRQHNGEIAGGAKYTRPRRPVRIVFECQFEDDTEARRAEVRVKKLTHAQKERILLYGLEIPLV